jgi:type II secretory pathway component PulC
LRLGAAGITLLALALFCTVLAGWFWQWIAPPRTLSPTPPAREDWSRVLREEQFFGTARPAAAPGQAVPVAADFKLLGVVWEPHGGFALIRLPDQSTRLVGVGKEIASGVVIERIENDRVLVRDHGRSISAILRETKTAPPPAAQAVAAQAAAPVSRCPLAAAERKSAYYLQSELLDGVAREPRTWGSFLRSDNGALNVAQEAGAGRLLGLAPGDRLERSNGVQLASLDDLKGAFIRPLQENRAVRVTGTRQGKPFEWLYVNASVCLGR